MSTGPAVAPATYLPRIGVAVTTGSRTCVAIQNANLPTGSPITLVSPALPQSFVQGEISALATDPCPISQNPDTTVSSYDIHLTQSSLPKLSPLIAVTGTSAAFSMGTNNYVKADLQQNNGVESFRACSASDGAHLTVWSGNPLDGPLLWHGFYYEPGSAGIGPACVPKEMSNPSTP